MSVAAAGEARSRAVRAEFQRQTPCPSTGATRGACPGHQADHVQPLCAGGKDEPGNLQWLTVRDHQLKTKRDVAACFGRVHRP
ncbi:HNH endonuclease signature motif containing protein [Methylibium sp. Pch-M]|uniref:HNH endonuclease signature motif containing protein n=1 Tax=Methylibium sp. Pch-M TaxID=2082386 RepID=UPI001F5D03B5|nr:HNH endonuclease signature motif containing protein [Methylibium sp. Pch-M]